MSVWDGDRQVIKGFYQYVPDVVEFDKMKKSRSAEAYRKDKRAEKYNDDQEYDDEQEYSNKHQYKKERSF